MAYAQPTPVRAVVGHVRRPGPSAEARPVAVPHQWVVLHRVGSDTAGPLDSVRTDARGGFSLRYRPSGAADALYFLSSRYRGIAYFSPPLRDESVTGEDADVIVYDTTADTTALHVQGRHFVVSAPRGAAREVVEIFDVVNDGTRTVVARDSTTPVWSTRLPVEAESASVAPGDVAMGAVDIRRGRADVFAPFAPGARQLVLTYRLRAEAFPWTMPVERGISVVEVLLEEPAATAEGTRLVETQPATIDGRTFKRYLAQDVPASGVVRVTVPAAVVAPGRALRMVAAIMLVAMLVTLGVWLVRSRGRAGRAGPVAAPAPNSESDELVAHIARLDAAFERMDNPDAVARAAYDAERARLKTRLEGVLATEAQRA